MTHELVQPPTGTQSTVPRATSVSSVAPRSATEEERESSRWAGADDEDVYGRRSHLGLCREHGFPSLEQPRRGGQKGAKRARSRRATESEERERRAGWCEERVRDGVQE